MRLKWKWYFRIPFRDFERGNAANAGNYKGSSSRDFYNSDGNNKAV